MDKPQNTHVLRMNELREAAINEVAVKQTPHRLALLKIEPEFAVIEEDDNYKLSLFQIVNEYGADGITVAQLRTVFPEQAVLTKAKNFLVGKRKITEEKSGVTLLLKVVPGASYPDSSAAE